MVVYGEKITSYLLLHLRSWLCLYGVHCQILYPCLSYYLDMLLPSPCPPPHCYFLQALVPREFLTQLLKQSSLNSIFKNGLSHVTLASLVSALSILIVSPAWCSVHSVYVLSFSDFSLTLTFSMAIHSASLR